MTLIVVGPNFDEAKYNEGVKNEAHHVKRGMHGQVVKTIPLRATRTRGTGSSRREEELPQRDGKPALLHLVNLGPSLPWTTDIPVPLFDTDVVITKP